ncbi:MAG TPA: ABC transporter ATP-binding protein [Acidimicrobiales bacterium]|nr:ABC transporter ATP-binding protein [Acidimicrobiales bacterium]
MLEVRDLRVRYGRLEVLHGVSITVQEGEFVTVLGTNGAGKSTLLRACAGAMKVSGGSVSFRDVDLAGVPVHRVARLGLGYAMERGRVFQRQSVDVNLALAALPLGRRNPLKAELRDRVYQLFPVLKTKAKLPAGTMSGGERQMLAIAQALMSDPKLLVLDEPSAGLAPLLVSEVFGALAQLRPVGLSVLLAEQVVDEALEVCDRGYVLEAGRIVLSKTAEELRKDDAVREAYIGTLGKG